MNQYTAIWVDSFTRGSHTHSITRMQRIKREEGESIRDMLIREAILYETVFLFHGWPNECYSEPAPEEVPA